MVLELYGQVVCLNMKTRLLIIFVIFIFVGVILLSSFSIQKDDQEYVLFCTHWIFSDRITCDVLWNELDSDSPVMKNSASEDADDFDKTWGGPGNRHPAFLGYHIPDICTEDMIKHLVKHSNVFEGEEHFMLEYVGLPKGMNSEDFAQCYLEVKTAIVEQRENTLPIESENLIGASEDKTHTSLDIASIEDGRIILYPVDTCAGIDIDRLTEDEISQRYPATHTTKSGKTYDIEFLILDDDDLKEAPVISELIMATHQIPFPSDGGITAYKGLVEDPDWNNYLDWYGQKKAEQFNLDEVQVRGFVYNGEHYSIGFSIC